MPSTPARVTRGRAAAQTPAAAPSSSKRGRSKSAPKSASKASKSPAPRAKSPTAAAAALPPTPSRRAASRSGGAKAKAAAAGEAPELDAAASEKRTLGGPPPGILRRMFPNAPWILLPDILTVARVVAIPFVIYYFYCHFWAAYDYALNENFRCKYNGWVTSTIFAAAAITDFFDGYLARRWEITSQFGAFLDPVADKLMVLTSLFILSGRFGAIMAVPAALIGFREIGVSALREFMASKGLSAVVKVGWMGKCKTAFTMVSIYFLLLTPVGEDDYGKLAGNTRWFLDQDRKKDFLWAFFGFEFDFQKACFAIGMVLMWVSGVLTFVSGLQYFQAAAPALMTGRTVGKRKESKNDD